MYSCGSTYIGAGGKEKRDAGAFSVTKMVEDDRLMKEKLSISSEKADIFEHLLSVLETETGLDR